MSDRWSYTQGPERFGPVPFARLCELAAEGALSPDDPVQQEGAGWRAAGSVEGLWPVALPADPPGPGAARPGEVRSDSGEDQKKIEGAVSAFLAVPLYMVAVGFVVTAFLLELSRGYDG